MKKRWETAEDRIVVLVSKEDLDYLLQFTWKLSSNGYVYRVGYRRKDKNRETFMHRLVARARQGEIVHHRNGNKLDNTRRNLELLQSPQEHERRHHEERVRNWLRRRQLREIEQRKEILSSMSKS